jgi:hypothetical protein
MSMNVSNRTVRLRLVGFCDPQPAAEFPDMSTIRTRIEDRIASQSAFCGGIR